MTPRWTQDPEAKRLLALCVESRPKFVEVGGVFGANDKGYRFDIKDERVRKLRRIAKRYFEEAFAADDLTGDYSASKAETLSVEEAIEAAIAAQKHARAAASEPVGRLARKAVAIIAAEEAGRIAA